MAPRRAAMAPRRIAVAIGTGVAHPGDRGVEGEDPGAGAREIDGGGRCRD